MIGACPIGRARAFLFALRAFLAFLCALRTPPYWPYVRLPSGCACLPIGFVHAACGPCRTNAFLLAVRAFLLALRTPSY